MLSHHIKRLRIGASRRNAPVQHLACIRQLIWSSFQTADAIGFETFRSVRAVQRFIGSAQLNYRLFLRFERWCWWRFQVFWDMMPHRLIYSHWIFGWASCLHVHRSSPLFLNHPEAGNRKLICQPIHTSYARTLEYTTANQLNLRPPG